LAKSNRSADRPIAGRSNASIISCVEEDFLVAMAPAEPHQVVAQRRRQ